MVTGAGLVLAALGAWSVAAVSSTAVWIAAFGLTGLCAAVAAVACVRPGTVAPQALAVGFGLAALAMVVPLNAVLGAPQFAVAYLALVAGFALTAVTLAGVVEAEVRFGLALAAVGVLAVFAFEIALGVVGPAVPVLVWGVGLAVAAFGDALPRATAASGA